LGRNNVLLPGDRGCFVRESIGLRKEKRLIEHPTPAELEAFVRGDLPPDTFRRVARHLLRDCSPCKALLAPHYEIPLGVPAAEPEQGTVRVYDEFLDRAFSVARAYKRHLHREEIRARKIAASLKRAGTLEALLTTMEVPLKGLGALNALLDRSWALRHENPQEAVNVARFAVDVAAKLDARYCGFEENADWLARAWGELGNAHRAADDLDEAERAFGIAFDFFLQGSGDPHLKARLYDLHASYWGTRRQFSLAFAALDIVHTTYLELGDRHLAGRALLIKAIYIFYSGQAEEAIQLTETGLSLIDKERDPALSFFAFHNRLLFLLACDRCREAKRVFFLHLSEFHSLDGRVNRLKVRWLQARISLGLKELKSAEEAFVDVKNGFEEEGMGYHVAIASLELGLVWMHQDRYKEAEEIVTEAAEVFVALRIQREAFGALMILTDAFKAQKATVALLESVVEHLRRSQIDPNAQFEPRWE
jgi:tetratricopeptide (TPR) repeat protein